MIRLLCLASLACVEALLVPGPLREGSSLSGPRIGGAPRRPRLVQVTKTTRWPPASVRRAAAEDGEKKEEGGASKLEDWRAFRAQLIATGLKTTEEVEEATSEKVPRPPQRGPSSRNVEVALETQPALAAELNASWAHELPQPEVGGLLVRLPLEVELVRGKTTYWGQRLRRFAAQNDGPEHAEVEEEEDTTPLGQALMYRVAQRFVAKQMRSIADRATPNERGELAIDARLLSEQERDLVGMHQRALGHWQEVVLVTEMTASKCSGVVLNRPVAREAGADLAAALVSALEPEEPSEEPSEKPPEEEEEEEEKKKKKKTTTANLVAPVSPALFVDAFGSKFAAYAGRSPQAAPGLTLTDVSLIHGVPDLPGAQEIAPGTGIYRGGSAQAAKNVIAGTNDALDFRFFIGKTHWETADLLAKVRGGEYLPVACARAIALKQCIGLPKPLWHEVLEMLGDTFEEVSKIELLKRTDLEGN